jgi:polyhydroxyalkanoate synthesis regulator phasin
MPAMRARVDQLTAQGELTAEEAAQLVAAIEARV